MVDAFVPLYGETAMPQPYSGSTHKLDRRGFIGGSDARVIMGSDEANLVRLWREKRGEAEPEDLSDSLVVQLGTVTEDLNRRWFERYPWIGCVLQGSTHPVCTATATTSLPTRPTRSWPSSLR